MGSLLTRRSLLRGLVAAPAVVAAAHLMPLRGVSVPDLLLFTEYWNGRVWVVKAMAAGGLYSDEITVELRAKIQPLRVVSLAGPSRMLNFPA